MMTKEQVLTKIKDDGLVAVIRASSSEQAFEIVQNCVDGGLVNIELTFTTPFAHRVIEDLAKEYGDNILLGAGTVLDSETARIAILSGAKFIVSPHFNENVTRTCNRYRIASMAGILTVTEAVTAMEAGVDVLKLFPGDLFGPKFIKNIHGPLPYAEIMPTGGVDEHNIDEWISAGAVAVGVGSNLIKGDTSSNVRVYLEKIKTARKK